MDKSCGNCLKYIKSECPGMSAICHLYTQYESIDYSKSREIAALESSAPLVPCDNCGNEAHCKPYGLNEGNAILCRSCWNKELRFQTTDEQGYTICDGSKDYYKRNFRSWVATNWYGL
jgi:hypothetical protein